VVVENAGLAEDEVRLTVEGAFDIAGVVESHSSRSLGLSYTLGISKDEAAPTVLAPVKYDEADGGKAVFNYEVVLPVLKRGRHTQQLYARKKATFDLVLHKGFWKGSEVLCQAVLPLGDLVTKSKCGGQVPFKAVSASAGGGSSGSSSSSSKRSKAVGGHLAAYVTIRSPLAAPEVVVVEERRLVVEPWPPVLAPVPAASPSPPSGATSASASASAKASAGGEAETGTGAGHAGALSSEGGDDAGSSRGSGKTGGGEGGADAAAAAAATAAMRRLNLTEKEVADPHAVDGIESNDVLEHEIELCQALLKQSSGSSGGSGEDSEDLVFSATLRLQLLTVKLQMLVYQVQSEALSLEAYMQAVKASLRKDQCKAMYFKELGGEDGVREALRIIKRVQIMKKEIQNVEDAAAAGEEEQDEEA
jgi:hypothetical protein